MSMQLYRFRSHVKSLIRARGLNIIQFARLMHVNKVSVYDWISGRQTTYWWRIEKAARILCVAPESISELSGKTRQSSRWANENPLPKESKECGYKRALEICGGAEYLTSSRIETKSVNMNFPVLCDDGKYVQK